MMRRVFAALALMLAACSSDGHAHGVSTDPNGATGFITEHADGRDEDGRPYGHALLGAPLPAFTASIEGGGVFDSTRITRWTVIRVWGAWCGDSRADGPYAEELASRIEETPDLDFISIHTPQNAARADDAFGRYNSLEDYFLRAGVRFPAAVDEDASIREALRIEWTPTYLLVSPDGIVRGFRTDLSVAGETPVDDFLTNIEAVKAGR